MVLIKKHLRWQLFHPASACHPQIDVPLNQSLQTW